MSVTRFLLALAYCLVGTAILAAEPSQTFKCEGPFGPDASHAKLAKEYGAANIDNEDYDWEYEGGVTVLFPKDPQRRLVIQWKDQKARRKPADIRIEGLSWSVAGVMKGTQLVELERLNGGSFKLNYFEGDYGGDVTDWMGGRLKMPFSAGCRVGVSVWVDDHLPEAVEKALEAEITPDRSLLSSGAGLLAAKPVVGAIFVSYPK